MQGKKHLYGGALALLLATVLLAGCGIDGTANATPSPTASAPPSPTATATSQPSPTPTTIIHGDWQTYTDTKYGFSLDVPAILSLAPTGTSGDAVGLYWAYTVKSPPPQGQAVFAETMIDVYATDTLTGGNPNPCTIGTPVTIGSGVRAYEADTIGVTSKGGGDSGPGGLVVNVATGGVYISIILYANPGTPLSPSAFRARYGAIWQHILNSFVPGPAVPNGHPCG